MTEGKSLPAKRNQRPEVGVGRDEHTVFLLCAFEDRLVAGGLHAVVADVDGVMTGVLEPLGDGRRQRLDRPGTSTGGDKRELALPNRLGRVAEGLGDVLRLEIRVSGEALALAHPVGDHSDDGRNRDPKATDARYASQLIRPYDDSLKRHLPSAYPENRTRPVAARKYPSPFRPTGFLGQAAAICRPWLPLAGVALWPPPGCGALTRI